jgi:glyoxalase/bleomycin resistance protein/dioxygenase superfamily protein
MTNIWHIGMAVPDLKQGMAEIGTLFDLEWRPVVVRSLTLTGGDGRVYDVDVSVTFSLGGPFAIELWKSIPDTPLATPESGWFHHIGYWADDFTAEADRLRDLGLPPVLTNGEQPLLNAGPGNMMVEPCDLHRDQPYLRDLFPAGSRFAGEPELPQRMCSGSQRTR